jgi:hypothetical protein
MVRGHSASKGMNSVSLLLILDRDKAVSFLTESPRYSCLPTGGGVTTSSLLRACVVEQTTPIPYAPDQVRAATTGYVQYVRMYVYTM